jgi:hypothetical protein
MMRELSIPNKECVCIIVMSIVAARNSELGYEAISVIAPPERYDDMRILILILL